MSGVKGVVNNLHVAGTTVPPAASVPPPLGMVDATGVVAQVDQATGTVTLQDGRVVRLTNQTVVWQPTTIQRLRPGAQVLLRDAAPVAVQPTASVGPPEWRMGTVRSVDRGAGMVVLTDGTVVRIAPTGGRRSRGRQRASRTHGDDVDHRRVRGQRGVDTGGQPVMTQGGLG